MAKVELLDTCVISDFVKGEINTLTRLKSIVPDEIAVSSITVMELQYGLALNSKRAKAITAIISDLLSAVIILSFSQNDAIESAKIRAQLKQQGRPIGSYDILLAGTAFNQGLIFVTSNINEFNRIDSLILENWRQ